MKTLIAAMLLASSAANAGALEEYIADQDRKIYEVQRDYDAEFRASDKIPVKDFELYQYRTEDGRNGYMFAAPVQ
jgi:hypothetical protein